MRIEALGTALAVGLSGCAWFGGSEPGAESPSPASVSADGEGPELVITSPTEHLRGLAGDALPAWFEWDAEKYPQLADIPLGEDGLPTDPALRPGPDGLSDAFKALLEEIRPGSTTAEEGGAEGPDTSGDPPSERRCADNDRADGCFLLVEAREVRMGAQTSDLQMPGYDPEAKPEEGPVHHVSVDRFWVMAAPVTATMVERCRADGLCEFDAEVGAALDPEAPDGAPARRIDHASAERVCVFFDGRLPTEAEWESGRSGTEGQLAWGLAGEWTSSLWAAYAEEGYAAPAEGEDRFAVRGRPPSADASPRAAARVPMKRADMADDVGFRCVWSGSK